MASLALLYNCPVLGNTEFHHQTPIRPTHPGDIKHGRYWKQHSREEDWQPAQDHHLGQRDRSLPVGVDLGLDRPTAGLSKREDAASECGEGEHTPIGSAAEQRQARA